MPENHYQLISAVLFSLNILEIKRTRIPRETRCESCFGFWLRAGKTMWRRRWEDSVESRKTFCECEILAAQLASKGELRSSRDQVQECNSACRCLPASSNNKLAKNKLVTLSCLCGSLIFRSICPCGIFFKLFFGVGRKKHRNFIIQIGILSLERVASQKFALFGGFW